MRCFDQAYGLWDVAFMRFQRLKSAAELGAQLAPRQQRKWLLVGKAATWLPFFKHLQVSDSDSDLRFFALNSRIPSVPILLMFQASFWSACFISAMLVLAARRPLHESSVMRLILFWSSFANFGSTDALLWGLCASRQNAEPPGWRDWPTSVRILRDHWWRNQSSQVWYIEQRLATRHLLSPHLFQHYFCL